VIIPEHCSVVGCATGMPCGKKTYFLTRYLIRETAGGHEVVELELDGSGTGMMRAVVSEKVLARADEVWWFPEKVQIHDRTGLVRYAAESGRRCTIFTGRDEHFTFVIDPDLSGFLTVHVYDIQPPRPHLSSTIRDLETCGLFGDLNVIFRHHIRDISAIGADVYPCRASGFTRSLDADPMHGGEAVAGCLTSAQVYRECYGDDFRLIEICPLRAVEEEPFIARCCRRERVGIRRYGGRFGAVVHWGATPAEIAESVSRMVRKWRSI